jgi:hypothetical protein
MIPAMSFLPVIEHFTGYAEMPTGKAGIPAIVIVEIEPFKPFLRFFGQRFNKRD